MLRDRARGSERRGRSSSDVVRTRIYLTRAEDWEEAGRAHREIFGEIRPANAIIVVRGFVDPRWLVEVEADAVIESPRDIG